ncbi:MAG: DUF4010 domain-containing protein [Dehalococcoidia bacterium]|nr:DUF4010 domain-containing protein [Dehalococcoidia bacterium]
MDAPMLDGAADLAVALGIGLLLGAERERRMARGGVRGAAGLRTFALVALLGGLAARAGGTPVVAVGLAVIGAATIAGYLASAREDAGLTSEVALVVAYLLGVLAQEDARLASAIAVTVTILLATRTVLHRFVSSVLTDQEVHDALILAAAAVVVLPLVPNEAVGPGAVLNPFAVWRLVVLMMGISAAGYIAIRALGPRAGLPVAGLAGGFVSSTATIGAMGARARASAVLMHPLVSGAVFSTVATVVQMAAVLAATSRPTLAALAAPLAAAGAMALGYAGFMALRSRGMASPSGAPEHLGRAFDLRAAVLLALIISGVTLLATVASEVAGTRGIVLAAALAGLADTHAPAIGVAALVAAGRVEAHDAVVPILAALTTNTVSKMVAAHITGGWSFARPVALGLIAVIVAAWVGWGVQAAL